MNRSFAIALFLICCLRLAATEQMPDIFIELGQESELETHWGYLSPLEHYFHREGIDSPFSMMHTANYRGHVAHWKITDGKLYLNKIMVRAEGKVKVYDENGNESEIEDPFSLKEYDLGLLFDDEINEDGRVASWFSGSVLVVIGAYKKEFENGSYTFLYEKVRTISIENGEVKKSQEYDYDEYRSAMQELYSDDMQDLSSNAQLLKKHYDAQISPKN